MLNAAGLARTAATIAQAQQPDGMIPWFPRGHGDPWNHIEAAMALSLTGFGPEARRAYAWLAMVQNRDGSWFNYYRAGRATDLRLDSNVCAYAATGVWHHYLATGDLGFLEDRFPMVDAAMGFVLRLQQPDGEVLWCVEADGSPGRFALLTASCSIYLSLRCAVAAAELLERPRPAWVGAAGRLAHSIVHRPECFAPKHRYAMDWYYPVLVGAVTGEAARARLQGGWPVFVMDALGVRCVSDQPWVTAAETAECAMAFCVAGLRDEARLLLDWAGHLRHDDGSYWTGCVHPAGVHFPGGERSTYGAAAVVLGHHLLYGDGPAERLFAGRELSSRVAALAGSP